MGESIRLARIRIKKEPNMLYFVKADEEGWLCIYKTRMVQGRRKDAIKNQKVSPKLALLQDEDEQGDMVL